MRITADLGLASAPHRARGGWHPGWLFRTGVMGTWFDPSDRGSLFQDAAGTIPVQADGRDLSPWEATGLEITWDMIMNSQQDLQPKQFDYKRKMDVPPLPVPE